MNSFAQGSEAEIEATEKTRTLGTVVVTDQREAASGREALRATETRIGKGKQSCATFPSPSP